MLPGSAMASLSPAMRRRVSVISGGEHGVKSAKPIHEPRKAFGSVICQKAGIHQASISLRHADIRVTSAVYVDSRSRVAAGLGYLVAPTVTDLRERAQESI